MKKITFLYIALVVSMILSCKQKTNEDNNSQSHMMNDSTMMQNDSTMMDSDSTMMKNDKMMANNMYACSMHPEVQGKLNDKCTKCGMNLTEPVTEK